MITHFQNRYKELLFFQILGAVLEQFHFKRSWSIHKGESCNPMKENMSKQHHCVQHQFSLMREKSLHVGHTEEKKKIQHKPYFPFRTSRSSTPPASQWSLSGKANKFGNITQIPTHFSPFSTASWTVLSSNWLWLEVKGFKIQALTVLL